MIHLEERDRHGISISISQLDQVAAAFGKPAIIIISRVVVVVAVVILLESLSMCRQMIHSP
jgi:hypothetical protein